MYDEYQKLFLGYSSDIFQNINEICPHIGMGDVYTTEVMALTYVEIDFALSKNAEKRKAFHDSVGKLLSETLEDREFQFLGDRIGFYGSILNGMIKMRMDSFAEKPKKEDRDSPLMRPVLAFCDVFYNLNALYDYVNAPSLPKKDLINNKNASLLMKFFREETKDIYRAAKSL